MTHDGAGGGLQPPTRPRRRRKLQIGLAVVVATAAAYAGWQIVQEDRQHGSTDAAQESSAARARRSVPPPASEAPIRLGPSTGGAARLTHTLMAAGFRCSDLNTPAGPVRDCFGAPRTGLTAWQDLQFTFATNGAVLAAQIQAHDEARTGARPQLAAALRPLLGVVAPQQTRAALASAAQGRTIRVAGGPATTVDDVTSPSWTWRRPGAVTVSARLPRTVAALTPAAFHAAIGRRGYACDASSICVKGPESEYTSVNAIAGPGSAALAAVMIDAEATTATQVTRLASGAVADAVAGLGKEPSAAALGAYLRSTMDRQPHQAYVSGWLVQVRPTPTGTGIRVLIRSPRLTELPGLQN